MMKPFFLGCFLCLTLFLTTGLVTAQFVSNPTSGVSALQTGLWSTMNNPSGIARESGFCIGTYYRSQFFLNELADAGFALSFPAGSFCTFAISYQQYGYSLYREQQSKLAISKQLSRNVSAGVRLDYHQIRFGDNYGKSFLLTGSAGVIIAVTDELHAGFSIYNPQKTKYSGESPIEEDSKIQTGISWDFGTHARLAVGADFDGKSRHVVNCSFDYVLSKKFKLFAGVSTGWQPVYLGYAFLLGSMEFCMQSGYHSLLGFSPQVSLNYRRRNND